MKNKLFFLIWTFFLLYLPPIIGVASIKIIGVFSWFYIFTNDNRFKNKFKGKQLLLLMWVALLGCMYVMSVEMCSMGGLDEALAVPLYLVIFAIPAAVAYVIKIDKMRIGAEDVIKYVIWAGIMEGTISIASLFSYSIQTIFIKKLYYVMVPSVADYWRPMRLYGWATGMTYSMPILSASIGVMALEYAINKNRKYLLSIPIIWLSGILNARTSMVVIIIGIVCVLISLNIFNYKHRKAIFIVIFWMVISSVGIFLVSVLINNDKLMRWIGDGVFEIINFLRGNNIGYFASIGIVSNTLELPPKLIFGMGYVGTRSDVGYIRDMWTGGIVYCGFVLAIFLHWLRKLYVEMKKTDKKLSRSIVLFFTTVLMAVNVKGQIVSGNEFMTGFLVLVVYVIYYKDGIVNESHKSDF